LSYQFIVKRKNPVHYHLFIGNGSDLNPTDRVNQKEALLWLESFSGPLYRNYSYAIYNRLVPIDNQQG
jgi:hypothetical protein